MDQVTRILCRMEAGEATPEELLSAVYEELRRLAYGKMARERADHTLQATALVHEAWLRLGAETSNPWRSRSHFFGAAAESMRRILVDHARKQNSQKRGAGAKKLELVEVGTDRAQRDRSAIAQPGDDRGAVFAVGWLNHGCIVTN
jgi:RNA polymerase sigma factor (TIGR02999 family)